MKRGRREDSGPYARFAREIDDARAFEPPADAMSEVELTEAVWRAVRKGNVSAMRLAYELLKQERQPKADAFASIDELAERRAREART